MASSCHDQLSRISNGEVATRIIDDLEATGIKDPKLRDVALHLDKTKLRSLLQPRPESSTSSTRSMSGSTATTTTKINAGSLQRELFRAEPCAVIQRMVKDFEIHLPEEVRPEVEKFFNSSPSFDIRQKSISHAIAADPSLQDINTSKDRRAVVENLKTLQRVQSLVTDPDQLPPLFNNGVVSASQVAAVSRNHFVEKFSSTLGEHAALQIHDHASAMTMRNQQALLQLRQVVRGTEIAAIDGRKSREDRHALVREKFGTTVDINLESLFGSLDYCECDDCMTIYSPSNYLVELLQFLRNNNLDPTVDSSNNPVYPNTGKLGIDGTPLELLFRRRPDIQHLLLTCENTNTLIPYLDLANEVMESFVSHLAEYPRHWTVESQSQIDAFNVADETSDELLAGPQHTNYEAYCKLRQAVFPLSTLPFHQPIVAARIYLNHLQISRAELLDVFTKPYTTPELDPPLTHDMDDELAGLSSTIRSQAIAAESLNIVPEEYLILCREGIFPKRYFDIITPSGVSEAQYAAKMGIRRPCEYWGYCTDEEMRSEDTKTKVGLTFVKAQFLKRANMRYSEVVDLLKTRFVNSFYPTGKDLAILNSIRFSYRFLQRLVDHKVSDRRQKFKTLISWLINARIYIESSIKAQTSTQGRTDCHPISNISDAEICSFVYRWFTCLGRLVVLESGEGPVLPIYGRVVAVFNPEISTPLVGEGVEVESQPQLKLLGTLFQDGTITDSRDAEPTSEPVGCVIGSVEINAKAYAVDGKLFAQAYSSEGRILVVPELSVLSESSPLVAQTTKNIAIFDKDGSLRRYGVRGDDAAVHWNPVVDTCSIEKVRLRHLDGSMLAVEDLDRMQRFIRLWKRLGWTINETDKALVGLAGKDSSNPTTKPNNSGQIVTLDDFDSDCCECRISPCQHSGIDCGMNDIPDDICLGQKPYDIDRLFFRELADLQKLRGLLPVDLIELLALWAPISIEGEGSLYARLFLTHNLQAIDDVFRGDSNGGYLPTKTQIISHLPVIQAALKLSRQDLLSILERESLADSDLTIENVTKIYRYALFMRVMKLKLRALVQAFDLFGNAFGGNASDTLTFVTNYNQFQEAGIPVSILNYVVNGVDDVVKPLGPQKSTVLRICKTLRDGLHDIASANADPSSATMDTIEQETVLEKILLLFEQSTAIAVVSFLNGTMQYTVAAPAGLKVEIPKELSAKVQYIPSIDTSSHQRGQLSSKGILTEDESELLKSKSGNSAWKNAVDKLKVKAQQFYHDTIEDIFSKSDKAQDTLLQGDIAPTAAMNLQSAIGSSPESGSAPPPAGTAPVKLLYFMQHFVPYLRKQLSRQFVANTVTASFSITSIDITEALLTTLLKTDDPEHNNGQSPLEILLGLGTLSDQSTGVDSYLVPPTSDSYQFVGFGISEPNPIVIDGLEHSFELHQDDPDDAWWTQPVRLVGGKLYSIFSTDQSFPGLQWKTQRSPPSDIPSSAVLPKVSSEKTEIVLSQMSKAALLINAFSLSFDEVICFATYKDNFAFDLNKISLELCLRMVGYSTLKKSLPDAANLLPLFKWAQVQKAASSSPASREISVQIESATAGTWSSADVAQLIGKSGFAMDYVGLYVDERPLSRLQKALTMLKSALVAPEKLFQWADIRSKFWLSHKIAEDIKNTIRARYSATDWEQASKPLHDKLRVQQRDALISHLITQQPLIEWGVKDADSLFEFFLIDVQMGACLKTSRIKQAISSVQTFVQRCFLGLETRTGSTITANTLDRKRWTSMQKQTLWAASMKVLVNPEDYLVMSLRDNKTSPYSTFENELLQKSVNAQSLQDSVRKYLSDLNEVANIQVEGLFQDSDTESTLYVVGRTRSAPFVRFYRTYSSPQGANPEWTPWQEIKADVTSYHIEAVFEKAEKTDGVYKPGKLLAPAVDGSYIVPVVFQKRFIIFSTSIISVTYTPDSLGELKLGESSNPPKISDIASWKSWEIKLAWSELRNGKWLQKQITSDSIVEPSTSPIPPALDKYLFIPLISPDDESQESVIIGLFNEHQACVGGFQFQGNNATSISIPIVENHLSPILTSEKLVNWTQASDARFHLVHGDPAVIYSLQAGSDTFDPSKKPHVKYTSGSPDSYINLGDIGDVQFNHPFAHQLLTAANTSLNLDSIPEVFAKQTSSESQFPAFGRTTQDNSEDGVEYWHYDENGAPFSGYNWEIPHAFLELCGNLLGSSQFDAALDACHQMLFDPYSSGNPWVWPPFQFINPENVIDSLFNKLLPHTADTTGQINNWRRKPFNPHVVARSRPLAYMKFTVMQYLQTLIAYGDYYFRQNTLEAVPLAIQCYILASHIYGPKAEKIPKRGKLQPQSYYSLLNQWDAISNAVVSMEVAFPFSNQTQHPFGQVGEEVALANIFGFATTHYFGIPGSEKLRKIRDTIDDRLSKIRNCLDINGNPISLALWEPPLDVDVLVAATAAGLSLSDILNDLNSPMPNYRFFYLLQKALELCTELKNMGNSFLAIKEKRDGEAMQVLRATHDNVVQTLVMQVRTFQLEEAQKTLEALRTSRRSPMSKFQYFAKLTGQTAVDVKEGDTDFQENQINYLPITSDGEVFTTSYEATELSEAAEAKSKNSDSGYKEMFASGLMALPKIPAQTTPWGIGLAFLFGPSNLGTAASCWGRYMRIEADAHTFTSQNASRRINLIKQFQDRQQNLNTTGLDLLHIGKQMATQDTRIKLATQEITNQQKQIENANEVLEFLKSKYTNDELYGYLENSVRTVFYQTYQMAYDLAKKAESSFLFERGPQAKPFINFGYWDVPHDGLQSGEKLYLALKQMEAAYIETRAYNFEITKSISLRQIDPSALLQLRATGTCQVSLPEILFDMDFPGHYFRRIKSVSVTLPCLAGPYTSINLTVQLLQHRYRHDPSGADKSSYPEDTESQDPRFATVNVPIKSIAVSTGTNDAGVFDLNMNSERYLPFEGAGVISTWQLDLPQDFRQFDYDSITDIIFNIRYTSRDGGVPMRKAASEAVNAFVTTMQDASRDLGLFLLLDIKNEYTTDWAYANSVIPSRTVVRDGPATNDSSTPRTIALTDLRDRLPIYTRNRDPTSIVATEVTIYTTNKSFSAGDFAIVPGVAPAGPAPAGDPIVFSRASSLSGKVNYFSTDEGLEIPIDNWTLQIGGDRKVQLEKLYMVKKYHVGKLL